MALYGYLGTALAALLVGWGVQGWRMDAEINKIQLEHSRQITVALQRSAQETERLVRIKDEAIERAAEMAQINARSATSARVERDRLREQLQATNAKLSRATKESTAKYAATLHTVFGECSEEVERLAKAADGHALDARTLKNSWGD